MFKVGTKYDYPGVSSVYTCIGVGKSCAVLENERGNICTPSIDSNQWKEVREPRVIYCNVYDKYNACSAYFLKEHAEKNRNADGVTLKFIEVLE